MKYSYISSLGMSAMQIVVSVFTIPSMEQKTLKARVKLKETL